MALTVGERYRQYKDDSSVFVTWVCSTASARGYGGGATNVAAISTGRLKGKERKEAKAAAKAAGLAVSSATPRQSLSVAEIVARAQFIAKANSPLIKVPFFVQRVLARAIKLRKDCSESYRSKDLNEDSNNDQRTSLQGHQHFIQKLEEVQTLLKPRFIANAPKLPVTQSAEQVTTALESLNLVEDPEPEIDIVAEEIEVTAAKGTTSAVYAKVYELEKSAVDVSFQVWCFIEDLHELLGFLRKTWENQTIGLLDIRTAAITTRMALEQAKQTEESLMDLCPEIPGTSGTVYQRIVGTLLNDSEILSEGYSQRMEHMVSQAFYDEYVMLETMQRGQRASFHYTPLVFGLLSIIPKSDRSNPDLLKLEQDYNILSRILLGLTYLKRARAADHRSENTKTSAPCSNIFPLCIGYFADIFLDILTPQRDHEFTCRVTDAFAIHILLVIINMLGDKLPGIYEKLRGEGARAKNILGNDMQIDHIRVIAMDFPQTQEELKKMWLHRETACQALQVSMYVNVAIATNRPGAAKVQAFQDEGHLWDVPCPCHNQIAADDERMEQYQIVWPSKDPTYCFSHNPSYCGLEMLRLNVAMENLGVLNVGSTPDLVAIMHLYNMVKQTKKLQGTWPALEVAMTIHAKDIFHGAIPETAKQINTRILLCMGIPLSSLARNARASRILNIPSGQAWVIKQKFIKRSPVSKLLEDYFDGNIPADQFLTQVNMEHRKGKPTPKRGLTLIQKLAGLQDAIEASLPQLQIDYITLNRQSQRLTEAIRKNLLGNDNIIFDISDEGEFSHKSFPMVVKVYNHIFGHHVHHYMNGDYLKVVLEIMETFLKEVELEDAKVVEPFSVESITNQKVYDPDLLNWDKK